MGEWGSGTKSNQRGTMSIPGLTNTATLSPAVDVSKTELRYLGTRCHGATPEIREITIELTLTNGTTVTGTRSSDYSTGHVSWGIVERR